MEHSLAAEVIPQQVARLKAAAIAGNKVIRHELVGDKDIQWATIVENLPPSDHVQTVKLDDVNHSLSRIFKCVKAAKNSLPPEDIPKSGLTKPFSKLLYRSIQYGLYTKPTDYAFPDMELAVTHYFSGDKHNSCSTEWCPFLKNDKYRPALAYGRYMDKQNDKFHEAAFDALIAELKSKFTEQQFKNMHTQPRTNPNESMNSMNSEKFNKGTRPSSFEVFEAQVASTAASKNEGRGRMLYDFASEFGYVSKDHVQIVNKIQKAHIYSRRRIRSDLKRNEPELVRSIKSGSKKSRNTWIRISRCIHMIIAQTANNNQLQNDAK